MKSFKSFNVDFYLASYVAFTCIAFLESLTHFLSPRFKTLNPKYIILISFNCTCIFYHIQLTRACPSPLAVIWYLCIGFVSKVNKTENLNSTDSQPGQQWTVFQIVTHTRLGGFKPMILNSRGASILQILISKFSSILQSYEQILVWVFCGQSLFQALFLEIKTLKSTLVT